MTWGKVSDRLHAHSKARRAREAMALWVLALSWCCDELTDGAVPSDMPELLIPGGDAMAEKLVSVGLWERTEAGFRFHDWAEYQPRAEDERERRSAVSKIRSEAGKRGNAKRWGDRSQPDSKHFASASQTDRKTIANGSQNDRPVPVPDPEPREEILPSVGTRAPEALALAPVAEPKPKAKRAKVVPADREPEAGTLAAKVRDVIVSDPALAPLVVAPGDLAIRICAEGAYPGVDVLAAVRAAGAWAAGKLDGGWRDGRAGLLGWLRREAATAARTPRPATQPLRVVAPPKPAEGPKVERKPLTLEQVQRAQRAILETRRAAGGES